MGWDKPPFSKHLTVVERQCQDRKVPGDPKLKEKVWQTSKGRLLQNKYSLVLRKLFSYWISLASDIRRKNCQGKHCPMCYVNTTDGQDAEAERGEELWRNLIFALNALNQVTNSLIIKQRRHNWKKKKHAKRLDLMVSQPFTQLFKGRLNSAAFDNVQ